MIPTIRINRIFIFFLFSVQISLQSCNSDSSKYAIYEYEYFIELIKHRSFLAQFQILSNPNSYYCYCKSEGYANNQYFIKSYAVSYIIDQMVQDMEERKSFRVNIDSYRKILDDPIFEYEINRIKFYSNMLYFDLNQIRIALYAIKLKNYRKFFMCGETLKDTIGLEFYRDGDQIRRNSIKDINLMISMQAVDSVYFEREIKCKHDEKNEYVFKHNYPRYKDCINRTSDFFQKIRNKDINNVDVMNSEFKILINPIVNDKIFDMENKLLNKYFESKNQDIEYVNYIEMIVKLKLFIFFCHY